MWFYVICVDNAHWKYIWFLKSFLFIISCLLDLSVIIRQFVLWINGVDHFFFNSSPVRFLFLQFRQGVFEKVSMREFIHLFMDIFIENGNFVIFFNLWTISDYVGIICFWVLFIYFGKVKVTRIGYFVVFGTLILYIIIINIPYHLVIFCYVRLWKGLSHLALMLERLISIMPWY